MMKDVFKIYLSILIGKVYLMESLHGKASGFLNILCPSPQKVVIGLIGLFLEMILQILFPEWFTINTNTYDITSILSLTLLRNFNFLFIFESEESVLIFLTLIVSTVVDIRSIILTRLQGCRRSFSPARTKFLLAGRFFLPKTNPSLSPEVLKLILSL